MITAILVVMTIVMVVVFVQMRKHGKRYPPGPMGIPFLGSMPFLGSNPYKTMAEWSKTYGDMFSMSMGPMNLVIMNTAELIRDASKKNEFSGRPEIGMATLWATAGTGKLHGIVFNEGNDWQEQRRFALRQLRDLGFGKRSMEDLILHEVQEFMEILKIKSEKPFEVQHLFEMSVVNALWTLVAGHRFETGDKRLQQLSKDMLVLTDVSSVGFVTFFPRLAKLFPNLLGWNKLANAVENIRALARDEIEKHKKDFNPDSPRDLIDIYLKEIQSTKETSSSFFKSTGEFSLMVVLMDLFAAGIETTTTALNWGCLLLSVNPQVQHKLQEEVDNVIGRNKMPALADREKMPYVEATMHEILRFSSMIPLLVFHKVMVDTEFHGYVLPKDTLIAFNAYHVMRNPKHFDKPDEFCPERFLANDGSFKNNENFFAFGTGKRVCLGENLAKIELFLFLTAMVQRFHLKMPEDNLKPSVEYNSPAVVLHPKSYKLVLSERKC